MQSEERGFLHILSAMPYTGVDSDSDWGVEGRGRD